MKQIGIVFSHSDYVKKSHGTERCIREVRNAMLEKEADFIQIFPIRNRKLISVGLTMVGVNFAGEFLGLYKLEDVDKLYHSILKKHDCQAGNVQIHHLMYFDLKMLAGVINKLQRPVVLFGHDYFMLCSNHTLIDSNNRFCNTDIPREEKCRECAYQKDGINHFKDINSFLSDINEWIENIIVPSDFVNGVFRKAFGGYESKVITRPHLVCSGEQTDRKREGRLKIAYVGVQNSFKGFDQWLNLVENFKTDDRYEFHYFGNGEIKTEGVIYHEVSIATQGDDAMKKALKESNVDICLFWPNWPETYSYVLYELLCNGIFVVTNNIAGNVTDIVSKHKCGLVLNSREEMLELFRDYERLYSTLCSFAKTFVYPVDAVVNKDVSLLLSTDGLKINTNEKAKKWKLLTWIYLKKIRPAL